MKISKDQNEITLENGVKLVASKNSKLNEFGHSCDGCYFYKVGGVCCAAPIQEVQCMSKFRTDNRDVIFIQKDS